EIFTNLGKGFDLRQSLFYLRGVETHKARRVVNVLTSGKLRIETHTQLEYGGYTPVYPDASLCGLQRASDHFQQCRFPRAVVPHYSYRFAGLDRKANPPEYPLLLGGVYRQAKPATDSLPFRSVSAV